MDSEQTSMSSEQFLGILRRRAPWILLCVALVAGAAYGYAKHKPKKYTATAAIAFNSGQLAQEIAGLSVNSGLTPLAQQQINLELVKVGGMAARTARLLGNGLTEEKVVAGLSISARGETNIVDVTSSSTSPAVAAAIANTYARQFVKSQQRANRDLFKSALTVVNRQLAGLSPAQRVGTDGLNLQNRAQTLALLAELGYNDVEVVQEASVPSSPSSPKVSKDTAIGALVGLLLGLGIAFLLEGVDRRIRRPEDLEAIYHLPVLGTVPKSGALAKSVLPPAEAEAFNLIRAHLRFFSVDRDVRTIVIASPASGDGKTTIARHLAEAATRLGSRVLLLEVDLRQPTLAQQLGIKAGPGLADVLIGALTMDEATQSVALEAPRGQGVSGRRLDVLVAGAVLPPNPGELLESNAMDTVLAWAKSAYDLVVIDTPPLTAVSDAFPLLTKVDGVIIVGRVGHSRRDPAEQLQQILAGSGASMLGVIANGAKSTGIGSYAAPGGGKSSPKVVSADSGSSSEEFAPTAQV
jgi:polysaccharide biosynthesis transport protein